VVELTHLDSNPKFDIGVAFTTNYSFSGSRRLRRQRGALDDRLRESQDQTGCLSDVLIRIWYVYVCS
jgi:hypothetical protein